MGDYAIKTRNWAIPGMFFVLSLAITTYHAERWTDQSIWIGYGFATVFGAWVIVNFAWQAVMVGVEAYQIKKAAEYQLSGNHLANMIKTMNSEQLQTLRMYGSTVIQYLVADDDEDPVEIIYGTEVSLAFALYFLTKSNERQTCPIRDFMDGTYHWDWTGENRIQDRKQAKEFTAWLLRYGYAEFKGGNMTALWREYVTPDGMKAIWSPEKVMRKLGFEANDDKG